MVGVPLVIATLVDRSVDKFTWYNEIGFLVAGPVSL